MKIRDWDRNLKVRLFGEALMNVTFWMFFPFMAIYFTEAFGKDKAGFLLIFSQVFSVVASLLGGYCADRFGRKRMMVLSAYGMGLAFFFFALASSPWFTSPFVGFLCFTLAGIFGSFYWPASQAMVTDVVPEEDRNSVFAVFYTSINIAVVIGPMIGGIFYEKHLFELLLATGFSGVLLATILAKMLQETVPVYSIENGSSMKWYQFLREQIHSYGIIIRDKTFLLFIVAGILVAQTFMQLDLLIPVYIKEVAEKQTLFSFGDYSVLLSGEKAFGVLISENGLLVALFTVWITKWMSHYRESSVFIWSSILYGIAIIMFGQTTNIWGMIGVMAVFTFAELMTAGIQQTFISKLAPEEMRGQYFAAASLRWTIGRTIAPFSITLTLWIGYEWTFLILSVLAFFSAFIYFVMFQQFEKQQAKNVIL
ncbi:putative MFS family arabinose efflux permease [Anoxybacillus vitaminiphilus]|uniref:Putative MFS family arabinose efflux permease n=1 Tax=Paranoxybacillus vitaminiphilus TaxID=581036 RepID=A0A327Y706_9BACL|nr:MFS transporter [Anoxybacillus vitaminiphilus]RAK16594.1 putative MFS family arabinose efflux permease [Anoxybacillus vitaminiphilus]